MIDLPPSLSKAIRRIADERGRKGLAASAAAMSRHYRQSGTSRGVIASGGDAVAYALSRMPATYAAVSSVLAELQQRAPGFAPASLLDAGAGPGTAAWAASAAFPEIGAATLMDHNREFLAIATALAEGAALEGAQRLSADLERFDLDRRFDLVTCAYALTELVDDAVVAAAEGLWRHCDGVLVIVEPGRPRDYQRLMAARARLIDLAGRVLAPCPHEGPCPLQAPDWCHFSVRLPRTRDHMQMKGGSLGYEDEKFSYLVVAREGIGAPAPGRVIRRPEESKFAVTLSVCAPSGIESRTVTSRDRPAFKVARKLDWGDATD